MCHPLTYECRNETGRLLGTDAGSVTPTSCRAAHDTLTVRDRRGGDSQDTVSVQWLPYEEIDIPQGGVQTLRIRTREDAVSVDQVVLSARTHKTTRPGAVKNDATILPFTAVWGN